MLCVKSACLCVDIHYSAKEARSACKQIWCLGPTLAWRPPPGRSEVSVLLPPPWCSKQSGLVLKTLDPVPPLSPPAYKKQRENSYLVNVIVHNVKITHNAQIDTGMFSERREWKSEK